jgi:hypothetical protein
VVLCEINAMRVRTDSVFISSVLYTIALVSLVRPALWNYYATSDKQILARLDPGLQADDQMAHLFGIACLTIILIGLIVVWTGYINRVRSAWLVMFALAAVWAFPVLVLPFFQGRIVVALSEWIYTAIYQSGLERTATELILIFSLMVIALMLPIRSFFLANETGRNASHRPSVKLISGLAVVAIIAGIALFTWIRVGAVYTIPADLLTSQLQQLVPNPPPPPSNPCKSQ